MKSVMVKIAGKDYVVESLKFKAEREWRKKYDKPISDLISAVSNVKNLAGKEYEKPADMLKDIGLVVLSHADDLIAALLRSPDILFEAVCDYSPVIKADRAYVEENAYQDEVARAFVEVLQIAYPFGQLLGIVKSLGRMGNQTAQNSPEPNGESGKTN